MTSDSTTPIVVVAYNRARSLDRLLKSIARADYPSTDIPLIISIDKADDNNDVIEVANTFKWNFGTKEIANHDLNLGLRKHVLKCGDLSQQYGSVIVLEDDLFVSANFYEYGLAALKFSHNDDSIGGISLYNHQLNVHNREYFSPIEDGYDNWYFQFASSWGQAWSNKQWEAFKSWYESNQHIAEDDDIPLNVSSWSEKSWLKFYISYLIKKNKYFLYPKISLTSNFSDAGTHVGEDSTAYQVPLAYSKKRQYNFSTRKESRAVYDAFFENQHLYQNLNLKKEELCIDLYANKNNTNKRYWLTTAVLNFEILKTFGRSLKPIDANIIQNISGNELYLYDTKVVTQNKNKINIKRKIVYNIKYISFADSKSMFLALTKIKIKAIFDKVFKR